MHSLGPLRISVILCFVGCCSLGAFPQGFSSGQPPARTTLAEASDGLKSLLQDIFAAIKSGDTQKSSELLDRLSIPNHGEWFLKTFGPFRGQLLDYKYSGLQAESLGWLRDRIEGAAKQGKTNITIRFFRGPEDAPTPLQAVLQGMIDPTPIYEASGNSPGIVDSAVSLGEFVYVNQGFRYLDRQVFLGFTTDSPMRITIAGAAQAKKLIHKVEPIYPPKAAAEHIEGTVKFFVVLGRDGSVEQISVTSGNPALLQSAIDAVKQWRYRPTVVGGIPFHVATDVEVDFHLNK